MSEKEKILLKEELQKLNKMKKHLNYSYETSKGVINKVNKDETELEKLEALTSRFERMSDIIVQKILRLIDEIELEREGTVIDRINKAEKRGLIDSAERFKKIRKIRNAITHEYIEDELEEIYVMVFELMPDLLASVEKINDYCKKYI
ncbi:MAG: DUF86 domain-containing protein [Clostridia bacterium]|jgi:uncharacterized protein YutE (UPF0331/DUF86 family)|nr:DUF86 domain-containing protein [Clostridia bacterium]